MAPTSEMQSWAKVLQDTQATALKITKELSVLEEVTQGLSSQTLSQAEFNMLNSKYREFLISVVQWEAPSQLMDMWNCLHAYRPESLVLNDVNRQIGHVRDMLLPLIRKAGEVNKQRSEALTMSFDQKVKTVRESIGILKQSLQSMSRVNQLLESAVFDMQTFAGKQSTVGAATAIDKR